jgi:hypothetical protein
MGHIQLGCYSIAIVYFLFLIPAIFYAYLYNAYLYNAYAYVSAKQVIAHHSYKGSIRILGHGPAPAPRLLCLVLWLGIAPLRSASLDGPKDQDLMLPLHSEFRREQRNLFDVNLFDEPDEPYEDYPTETGHNCGAGKKNIIEANPKAEGMLRARMQTPSL